MSSPLKRFCGIALLLSALLIAPVSSQTATALWRKAPQPKFPYEALKAFSEGSVTIRAVIAPNGTVRDARVTKTSGNTQLDAAALTAVRKWEMRPAAITPTDLGTGRTILIEFKQEAKRAALYRDRAASFSSEDDAYYKKLIFAPFPEYSEDSRRLRHEGTVQLNLTIGQQGTVANVTILQSSGYSELDDAAVAAVRRWRAHKQYQGTTFRVPIKFEVRKFW